MDDPQLLHRLAALPDVSGAIDVARAACTELRWHEALRRRIPQARAETTARAARDSAALEGAELPVGLVRDVLRGARPAPTDAVGRTAAGAIRATVEAHALGEVVRTAPMQALARLHTAAAVGLVPDDVLGRPREKTASPFDLPGPGRAPSGPELSERLDSLAGLLGAPGHVPALVVAALAHGEVMALRPFLTGNGVVARALFRAVVVQRGLDPTGVAVPESAVLGAGLPAYAAALNAYVTGTADGLARWLVFCARSMTDGAAHGRAVADAVLVGRLSSTGRRKELDLSG